MSIDTALLVEQAYARLAACVADGARVPATAQLILAIYGDFYRHLCEYPHLAQRAFETMDPHASIRATPRSWSPDVQ